MSPLYAACAKRGVPTWIVGVGWLGDPSDIHLLKPHIVGATVRDDTAKASLEAHGVPCRRFIDPAFNCFLPKPEKAIGLACCFRAAGGNGVHSHGLDAYWRKFDEIHAPDVVLVHEPKEVEYARAIFGRERVLFFSDWRAYLPVYAAAKRVFSGRIHGAVPALAGGAAVWLVYDEPKVECMTMARDAAGSTLTMLSYADPIPEELPPCDPSEFLRFIRSQGREHAEYLRARTAVPPSASA